jgi:hypothetical protein
MVHKTLLTVILLLNAACAALMGSWDRGLPKDGLPTEDRLWYLVFPLSVAAADQCVFERESTYGFFLDDATMAGGTADRDGPSHVRVRYVHPELPAGKAGIEIGDWVVAVNDEPVGQRGASAVSEIVQRATRARIQPLTLTLSRASSVREVHLWAVPSCRLMVKLLDSPVVNAFSDGSHIMVTSGLLAFVRSPDELAWVLAHEIGHHALEHSKRAKLQDVLNRFLTATTGEGPQKLVQIESERQADQFAAHLLVRAGFDLQKARGFLERMQTSRSRVATAEFARSHPSDQERLAALDRIVHEIQEQHEKTSPVTVLA